MTAVILDCDSVIQFLKAAFTCTCDHMEVVTLFYLFFHVHSVHGQMEAISNPPHLLCDVGQLVTDHKVPAALLCGTGS